MKGALGIQMNRIIEVILHAVDLLLLTVRVAVLTLARRVRIAQATPPGAFRRPPSDNFEGILVNHRGHVRRVAPAYWPHTTRLNRQISFSKKNFTP
jgi:hypothetical protein